MTDSLSVIALSVTGNWRITAEHPLWAHGGSHQCLLTGMPILSAGLLRRIRSPNLNLQPEAVLTVVPLTACDIG
jgi:hypothetical protein